MEKKESKQENEEKAISSRSSTLRGEYVKRMLKKNEMSRKEKEEYFKKYGLNINKCAYCGGKANTIDHIYAVVNDKGFSGYTNDISNLIPACSSCNSSKGKLNWDEWIKSGRKKAIAISKYKDFSTRMDIINNYIEKNETENKKMSNKEIDFLNKKINEYNKKMEDCLNELDKLFNKQKKEYMEMKNKRI